MARAFLATQPVLNSLICKETSIDENGRMWASRACIHRIARGGIFFSSGSRLRKSIDPDEFLQTVCMLFQSDTSTEMFHFDLLACVLEDLHGTSFSPDEWQEIRSCVASCLGSRAHFLRTGSSASSFGVDPEISEGPTAPTALHSAVDDGSEAVETGCQVDFHFARPPAKRFRGGEKSSSGCASASASVASLASDESDGTDVRRQFRNSSTNGSVVSTASVGTEGSSSGSASGSAAAANLHIRVLKNILATKEQKIKEQSKQVRFWKEKCSSLKKQLGKFTQDAKNTLLQSESGKDLQISRINSQKARKKELEHLQANRIDAYFLCRERNRDTIDVEAEGGKARQSRQLGWTTAQGCLALSIRRNMSNCSAQDLGLVILDDSSQQTVLRSECRTAASLIASARLFFQSWRHECSEAMRDGCERTSFLFLAYREDATNSSRHRSKLTALELHAAYGFASDEELPSLSFEGLTSMRRLADVLPVHDSSGSGTVALSKKMLESLGSPTWDTFVDLHESNALDPTLVTVSQSESL